MSMSVGYNPEMVLETLQARYPNTVIHGLTSCLGCLTRDSVASNEQGEGFALWAICDPAGSFAVRVVTAPSGKELEQEVISAMESASVEVGGGISTDNSVVWTTSMPGYEEFMLQGLESWGRANVEGPLRCCGGSAADNTLDGNWMVFGTLAKSDPELDRPPGVVMRGVPACVFLVMRLSVRVQTFFINPYKPVPGCRGKASEISGGEVPGVGRTIVKIGGRNAGQVYREWVDTELKEGYLPADLDKNDTEKMKAYGTCL